MRRLLAVGMLALSSLNLGVGEQVRASEILDEGKIRVLLITGGHEFDQASFYALFDAIPDLATSKASFPAAAELLDPRLIEDYDVIVFYDMWSQGITRRQQQAFVKLLEKGIGVVALHHTLAAHEQWPEYAKIIGGRYHLRDRIVNGQTLAKSSFRHDQDVRVNVAPADHPVTRGLKSFEIHDETYRGYDTDPSAEVLLTTNHPYSSEKLAWTKTYGHSRVFYLQLGHDHHAYNDPNYRLLVARGIRWAAGRPTDSVAPPIALFNGRNLEGWKQEGGAHWEVRAGVLVGQQGSGNSPGDLLTEASFDDFELKVTFRVEWPANSGVWYRYQSAQQAFQADILEYKEPRAWTGTLYCSGKMFIAINKDPHLVNRDVWNTFLIRAVGNRHVVILNGTQVADVRDDTSDRGRIGFQIHAGDQFAKMRLFAKEVSLRPL